MDLFCGILGRKRTNSRSVWQPWPVISIPSLVTRHRYELPATWMEADIHRRYPQWLGDIIDYCEKPLLEFHPAVRELEQLIENNVRIKALAGGMCAELVAKPSTLPGNVRIDSVRHPRDLLHLFNYMLRVPPLWNYFMFEVGLHGAPFNLLLVAFMRTECGFAFFQDPEVNNCFRNILSVWAKFLETPESASCLNESHIGWFGPEALQALTTAADLYSVSDSFEDMYVCDPNLAHHGFKSWDDFFTRKFRDGVRPVMGSQDDSIITGVCEALPWCVKTNVKQEDTFWAKGAYYSLTDMLGRDPLSQQFVGGTVYQAYLSALTYHRWHSPVTGTVIKGYKIPGLYFSEPLHQGFGPSRPGHAFNPNDINSSQSYLSAVATRAVIFIKADNPDIGLVAMIFIGMAEVSSCDITVVPGQRVEKGENIGLFHYGGSTHCVIFRPQIKLDGLPNPATAKRNLPVRGFLARAVRR